MRNVILAGFMGTGKTEVGKSLARLLDRPFVDMDQEIECRSGETPAEIFARRGEPSFRRLEKELARELAQRRGIIIAAGGGAFLSRRNLEALARSGEIVCLAARPESLVRRLQGSERPLLAPARGMQERTRLVRSLVEKRDESYRRIPLHLSTDGKSPRQLAREINTLLTPWPARVEVRAGTRSYGVEVTPNLLEHLGPRLRPHLRGKAVLITDERVDRRYGTTVRRALRELGADHRTLAVPPGESSKSLPTARSLYRGLLRWSADRQTTLIALGGGVVGDLAGYVAATFKRGVPLVHLPTTLVAQIDSSIGGKNGVNLPEAKNQVGTFHQPLAVLADPRVLTTLHRRDIRSGLAEAVKTALIGSPELMSLLEESAAELAAGEENALTRVVELAVRVKARVVTRDPWERDERRVLNLGHTLGHALEKRGSYRRLSHGEAVSLGMVAAFRAARGLGLVRRATERRTVSILRRLGLPVELRDPLGPAIWQAIAHDKKIRGGKIWLALPRRVGRVEIVPLTLGELKALLADAKSIPGAGARRGLEG